MTYAPVNDGTNTRWCKHFRAFPRLDVLPCPRSPQLTSHGVWIAWAAACGILAVLTLFGMFWSSSALSECTSTLAQVTQGLDSTTANNCGTIETIHAVAKTAVIICGLGCLCSIWKASRK